MNDKLILNTTLLRKEPCYEPKPCIVERVVEMSAGFKTFSILERTEGSPKVNGVNT